MKVITIANQKGGCGKTITAINLAFAISLMNRSVLFIDLDPQGHATTTFGLKNPEPSYSSFAIFDSFLNRRPLEIQSIIHRKNEHLSVIGAHILLNTMEQNLANVSNRATVIARTLMSPDISDFQYVVIDTPPNLGIISVNAILAAHHITVPLDISSFSINGVRQINEIIDVIEQTANKRPDVRFLIAQFDGRSNFAKDFLKKAKEIFGYQLLNTVIRPNVKLREAASAEKSIFEYAPSSNGTKDYTAFVKEILPELADESIIPKITAEKPKYVRHFFRYYAPQAASVYIAGTFNNWVHDELSLMKKLDNGMWVKMITLPEGTYEYKFVVDGDWKEDPKNGLLDNDAYGGRNSVLLVKNNRPYEDALP